MDDQPIIEQRHRVPEVDVPEFSPEISRTNSTTSIGRMLGLVLITVLLFFGFVFGPSLIYAMTANF